MSIKFKITDGKPDYDLDVDQDYDRKVTKDSYVSVYETLRAYADDDAKAALVAVAQAIADEIRSDLIWPSFDVDLTVPYENTMGYPDDGSLPTTEIKTYTVQVPYYRD